MKKDLKKRIDEHNRKVDCLIKYRKDDSKRIIVATLEVNCDKSLINNTVTG